MKQGDLEKVQHYSAQLKKLKATERLFADAPEYVEILFPGGIGTDGPRYRIKAGDEHYQAIITMARLQNKHDIEEVRGLLRSLGVEPE